MHRTLTYTTVLALVLALILVIGAIVLRPQFRAIGLQPYPALMPGQPVPPQRDLSCYWHYYNPSELYYCSLIYDHRVTIGYHASGRIESTWVHVDKITIGDLILAWGEPSGYTGGTIIWYVYFGAGRAAFIGSPYTPASKVYFVKYEDPAQSGPIHRWRGWQSAKRS